MTESRHWRLSFIYMLFDLEPLGLQGYTLPCLALPCLALPCLQDYKFSLNLHLEAAWIYNK